MVVGGAKMWRGCDHANHRLLYSSRVVLFCLLAKHKGWFPLIWVPTTKIGKSTARSIEIVPRGGPHIFRLMLMNSRGGPPTLGLYVDEF